MIMKRLIPGFLTLGLVLLLGSGAQAAFMTGNFNTVGNFWPVLSNGTLSNLVSATSIDYILCNGTAACIPPLNPPPPLTPGVNGQFLVTGTPTGSFGTGAGNLNLAGQIGSIRDFTFTGAGSLNFPNTPVTAFQVVTGSGTLTFSLTSINSVVQNNNCGSGGATHACINLTGTGTFSAPGFDDTIGNWSFHGEQACQVTPPTNTTCGNPPFVETFVFNTGNSIPSVPEPSTLLLLGAGLIG